MMEVRLSAPLQNVVFAMHVHAGLQSVLPVELSRVCVQESAAQ